MIGLMVYLACGLWILFAVYLGGTIPKWLAIKRQGIAASVLIPLIAVAPFYDEIIGKYQFNQLCGKYGIVQALTSNQSYATLRPIALAQLNITNAIKPTYLDIVSYGSIDGIDVVRVEIRVNQQDGWILRWLGLAAMSHCGGVNMFTLPMTEQTAMRKFQYPELKVSDVTLSQIPYSIAPFGLNTAKKSK
jgi:hypothetical protein